MNKSLLLGIWRHLIRIPRAIWQREVSQGAESSQNRLGFMLQDHHRVRDFVVLELPRFGMPIPPEHIAENLNLPMDRTIGILDELERNMTFLFRNEEGAVSWAYPVTADVTPHRITFSTGEQIYAAWAVDAIATPFVQGQLREQALNLKIESECGHCGRPLTIEIDSRLNYSVLEEEAEPLIFMPILDFDKLEDPSIIDAF